MQVASFHGFFIIYMQMFLLNAEPDNPVEVMNDMFTHVGWLEWPETIKKQAGYVHIIDHGMNEKIIDVKHLLAPSDTGRIVTKDNVEHKMQQAHQFLSCKYVTVLKKFCDYERGIGPACMKIKIPSDSLKCLNNSLKMLKKSEPMVMCMRGSLLCFNDLSPNTPFENKLIVILETLIDYYTNIRFDRHSIAAGGYDIIKYTVATETASVEKKMSEIFEQLNAFYKSFCWRVQVGKIVSYADFVQEQLDHLDPNLVMVDMLSHIKDTFNLFIESFDGRFGFKYNFDSKKTILMYDPDLLRRVEIMNMLLEKPGWTVLRGLEIKKANRYVTFPEFLTASADGKIVTKANIDEKAQYMHHFLNCHYAITLKRCIDYVSLIWKQYNKHMDLPDLSDLRKQIVTTIMISKPLVTHMHDALSSIYQLSPQMNYSVVISDILVDFNNYFHSEETIDSIIVQGELGTGNKMENISERLNTSYEPMCFPHGMLKRTKFLKDNEKFTLDILINKFQTELGKFMLSNYQDLGFPFCVNLGEE